MDFQTAMKAALRGRVVRRKSSRTGRVILVCRGLLKVSEFPTNGKRWYNSMFFLDDFLAKDWVDVGARRP